MREFLHHLFLPHESNNYRAKILQHKSILLIIAALFIGQFFLTQIQKGHSGVLGITANISADELLQLTNQKRSEAGQAPLVLNQELSQAAYKKGQDMLAKNYWAHNSPEGLTPWVFIKSAGYDYLYAGENLAKGFITASDTVTAWMNSSGHRDNMLSPNYKDIGFAVVTGNLTGDETVLVVEMLGSRNTSQISPSTNVQGNVSVQRIVSIIPTAMPTAAPTVPPAINYAALPPNIFVASVQSEPLIDKQTFTKRIGILLVGIVLVVLVADIIFISRRRIVRIITHNLDHIIYFAIILLSILIMARGVIL